MKIAQPAGIQAMFHSDIRAMFQYVTDSAPVTKRIRKSDLLMEAD
jgi:hypothetical protein